MFDDKICIIVMERAYFSKIFNLARIDEIMLLQGWF
jgi:hypothetical protein